MESGDSLKSNAPSLPVVDSNVAVAAVAPEAEWHSVPLERSLRPKTENCFLLSDANQVTKPAGTVDLSMCGLSKLTGRGADDVTNVPASKFDCKCISTKPSEDRSGLIEDRFSTHGLGDPKTYSKNVIYQTGCEAKNYSGPILGHSDDGCLRLLQQIRDFVKAAKLSCAGLLFWGGEASFQWWSFLLQRSSSFKASPSSTCQSEFLSTNSNSPALNRSASVPTPTSTIFNTGTLDALKTSPLQARDPSSTAEALPLAHYRPTDGPIWKEGDAKTAQSPTSRIWPVSCKKPPKPPRHPGRYASLDSASLAAQRASKKCRDKVSTKRRSTVVSAPGRTGLTPLVAVLLTLGFGLFMVFQGVFVHTNLSYGRNVNGPISLARKFSSYESFHPIEPHLPSSLSIAVSNSEAIKKGTVHHSMTKLPWSRSLLNSQVELTRG